jgi:2'-5' RNA ligase
MGGRFGKYGDHKRLKALQRGRREKSRLERAAVQTSSSRTDLPRRGGEAGPAPVPAAKTCKTALVIIPPEAIWAPIQELRRSHDRRYRRWMPHITLVFPFRPVPEFESLTPLLAEACRAAAPFEIHMAKFGRFDHGRQNTTLYLTPEPGQPLKTLQATLQSVVPDCDDVGRFPGGYTPHLSVGQVRGGNKAPASAAAWQAAWRPLSFTVSRVCLIWRNNPPDDVFRVGPVLPLGG